MPFEKLEACAKVKITLPKWLFGVKIRVKPEVTITRANVAETIDAQLPLATEAERQRIWKHVDDLDMIIKAIKLRIARSSPGGRG